MRASTPGLKFAALQPRLVTYTHTLESAYGCYFAFHFGAFKPLPVGISFVLPPAALLILCSLWTDRLGSKIVFPTPDFDDHP